MGKIHKALTKAGAAEKMGLATTQTENPTPRHAPAQDRVQNNPPPQPMPNGQEGAWDEKLLAATLSPGISESFRRLRAQILHPSKGSSPHTIMITSAIPSEGKSFVCANLGVSFAQGLEQHALMIDCDLRRPALGQLFGIPRDQGLSNYLQGDADLLQLIQKTSLEKLSIIPCGSLPANPSELLGSTKMQSLIEEVAYRYPDRYIFFDSPPVHAASETSVLAKHVEGIVLVVRWGKSGREQVQQLIHILGREKILGVVFNAYEMNSLETKFQHYSKTYDYYYSSNYGNRKL